MLYVTPFCSNTLHILRAFVMNGLETFNLTRSVKYPSLTIFDTRLAIDDILYNRLTYYLQGRIWV